MILATVDRNFRKGGDEGKKSRQSKSEKTLPAGGEHGAPRRRQD